MTSVYNKAFEGTLNPTLVDKIRFDKVEEKKLATITTPNHTNILKSAIENSDAIIYGSEHFSEELTSFVDEQKKPVLEFQSEDLKEPYLNFYAELISAE